MVGRAANTDPNAPVPLFRAGRERFWLSFFILFIAVDIVLLGLVSQQIHRHGGQNRFDYPTQEYGHVLGLQLFTTIFALLFGIFHWAAGLGIYLVVFLIVAVLSGTTAGVLEQTPFGHGLQCKNPVSSFPTAYQPYVSDCTRITTIEGLAWTMFALSVIGLFYAFIDQFSFTRKRSVTYESVAERGEQKQRLHDQEERERKQKSDAEMAHAHD